MPLCCWAWRSEASDTRGFRLTSGVELLIERRDKHKLNYCHKETIPVSMLFKAVDEYITTRLKLHVEERRSAEKVTVKICSSQIFFHISTVEESFVYT